MGRAVFTAEELAELAVVDAEIDAAPITQAERDESRMRDQKLRVRDKIAEAKRAYYEANRDKIAEAQRAYYEANRDKIAEAQRAYYEANRDKIAEAKRAYYEANRDKIAEIGAALRRWRKDHNCSQVELGELLGLSQRAVSYWERGEVPIDFERIERECPPVMEAFA